MCLRTLFKCFLRIIGLGAVRPPHPLGEEPSPSIQPHPPSLLRSLSWTPSHTTGLAKTSVNPTVGWEREQEQHRGTDFTSKTLFGQYFG